MANDDNYGGYVDDAYSGDDAYSSSSSTSGTSSRPLGPFGLDPLHYSAFLLAVLLLFVAYLFLPKGMRVHHFGAYPKRYTWSARPRAKRGSSRGQGVGGQAQNYRGGYSQSGSSAAGGYGGGPPGGPYRAPAGGDGAGYRGGVAGVGSGATGGGSTGTGQTDEVVLSAAMQQLREPGVLIVAHGSRGKPKTVRLQLTETSVTWRTETRKKGSGEPKAGKLHQVPLAHIMYVDVGKQTTALRRVENASVHETLCFSLLTKEGSLDLEANSPRERDALVSCFSLVLDEVHAQNWRDIYRGNGSEIPSSFDEMDRAGDNRV